MAERPITEFKGKHQGADIYIVAAGASAGYIEKSFFDNKISIGVNEVWKRFRNVTYLLRKETDRSWPAMETGIPMIVSRHNCGGLNMNKSRFQDAPYDYWVFHHEHNKTGEIDLSVIGTDKLIVSYSTITSAIHLAAYMGAANIILVGHDCGSIDEQYKFPEYPTAIAGRNFYVNDFLPYIEEQTIIVREALKEHYGCNIYSLNPWVNFGLEGHEYKSSKR